MTLIFKITDPQPSNPPQVGDTNFPSHYTGVNTSMAWQEITPGIRQAVEKFLLDFVGSELYDDLAQKFEAGDSLTDDQNKALELMQDCVAYYTIYHVMPEKRSVLASLGVVEPQASAGASPASFPIYREKRRSALDNADIFLDRLLAHLEQQVTDGVAYFDLWKNSDAYSAKTSDFFRSTSELDEYLNIQKSRRSFISIVRFLKQVEEDVIKPILCEDLYAQLFVPIPSAQNKKLIPMIRRAVAYLGAATAIPHHRIVTDGDGFRVVSATDNYDDRRNLTNNTHEAAIQALLIHCKEQGASAIQKLTKFLEANLTDYPLYRDSTCRASNLPRVHGIIQAESGLGAVGFF